MTIKRLLRYNYLKVLRLRDKPHNVSLGVAIGTSIMFLPVFGFATVLAYLVALILKANRVAAVLASIFWKWAFVGFYTLNYVVGRLILGSETESSKKAVSDTITHLTNFDFYKIGITFLIGSVINAVLSGILIYYIASKVLEARKAQRKAPAGKLLSKEE